MYAVVGGGIAGLAAAYRLQQRGHQVQVFEASPDVGGLAALHQTRGDPLEKFYHHLSKSEETIVELAEELGVGDRVEWRIGENAYYVDGVVHPLDKPWEILAYPHMSLYDKVRLALLTQEIDVRGGIPRFDTYEDLTDFEDVPIEEFLVEHTTRGVYDNFFAPLLDAKFGDRVADVSAAWLLGRIKFRGERDLLRGEILGYFDGSFGVLLDALVEAVDHENITTNARVTNVGFGDPGVAGSEGAAVPDEGGAEVAVADADENAEVAVADADENAEVAVGEANGRATVEVGEVDENAEGPDHSPMGPETEPQRGPVESITVETGDAGGHEETHEVDGVVVATMPNVLEDLTGYTCDIDFQGAVCATVTMDEPLTDTYWLNVADEAPFGALIEHTNFVPAERYGGDHLLYVASYVQSPEEQNWQDDDPALEERWLGAIADLFPDFDPDANVQEFRVARNPRAAPVYERGYLDMVIPYDLADEGAEGVFYAGMASRAQYPERSLNGGVVAGFEAADRIDEKTG